jgi:hypothetical protein
MIARLVLPLAMLVTVLAIGLALAISNPPAAHPVAMDAGVTQASTDGPPTCCIG